MKKFFILISISSLLLVGTCFAGPGYTITDMPVAWDDSYLTESTDTACNNNYGYPDCLTRTDRCTMSCGAIINCYGVWASFGNWAVAVVFDKYPEEAIFFEGFLYVW